jgi:tRNA-specific 2-thiouridylase
MRVLVAMSGGVDSSVAAALLLESGHEVVGATMKLWGGESDSGCCSVSDVEDARRAAGRLGIEHHVFNFTDEFESLVVEPYVSDHFAGRTPNPCVECNRHLKFAAFLDRAVRLGFDAVATGHHARVERDPGGAVRLRRGRDSAKDQSYVLSCLTAAQLERVLLPVGELQKTEVRRLAAELSLGVAGKPDSQEVCFVAGPRGASSRGRFLGARGELHAGRVVDARSREIVGSVPAVELVTVGQRRGLGLALADGSGERRFALDVDVTARLVLVGSEADLDSGGVVLSRQTWVRAPLPRGSGVLAQASAHGRAFEAVCDGDRLSFAAPHRRIAPGQLVALYVGDEVVGSGIAEKAAA